MFAAHCFDNFLVQFSYNFERSDHILLDYYLASIMDVDAGNEPTPTLPKGGSIYIHFIAKSVRDHYYLKAPSLGEGWGGSLNTTQIPLPCVVLSR